MMASINLSQDPIIEYKDAPTKKSKEQQSVDFYGSPNIQSQ